MKTDSPFAQSRRDGRRVPFKERVTIQTNGCRDFRAHDLSLTGLGVQGPSQLNEGEELLVRFDFISDDETYFAHGKVKWNSNEKFGIAFDKLGSSASRGIATFIDRQLSRSSD